MLLTLTIAAAAWAPATASAAFEHVVAKGETLSSVAAADGLSVSQLAAANGDVARLAARRRARPLAIPPQDAAAGESAASSSTAGSAIGDRRAGGVERRRGVSWCSAATR